MALLDILKKAKKKVDDAIPDFNIRQKAGQAVKQVGKTISNIEQTSQRAGSQARQQVNRALEMQKQRAIEQQRLNQERQLQEQKRLSNEREFKSKMAQQGIGGGRQFAKELFNLDNIRQSTGKALYENKPLKIVRGVADVVAPVTTARNFIRSTGQAFGAGIEEVGLRKQQREIDKENEAISKITDPKEALRRSQANSEKARKLTMLREEKQRTVNPTKVLADTALFAADTALSATGTKAALKAGKPVVKQIAKEAIKRTGQRAGIGAGFGAGTAISEGERDIKNIGKQAAISGGASAVLGGAIDVLAPKVIKGVQGGLRSVQEKLQTPKFQPGFASTKPKVGLEPKTPKGYKSAEELVKEGFPTNKYKNIDYKPEGVDYVDKKVAGGYSREVYVNGDKKGEIYLSNTDPSKFPDSKIAKQFSAETIDRPYKGVYFSTYKGAIDFIKKRGEMFKNLTKLTPKDIMGGQTTPQPAVEKAPVLKLATTEKPKDIPGFTLAPEAKTPKSLRIDTSKAKERIGKFTIEKNAPVKEVQTKIKRLVSRYGEKFGFDEKQLTEYVKRNFKSGNKFTEAELENALIKHRDNKNIRDFESYISDEMLRDRKNRKGTGVEKTKVLSSEDLDVPKPNLPTGFREVLKDEILPNGYTTKLDIITGKQITNAPIKTPKVEVSQPEVKRPQVETSKVIREKVFKKEPEISATPKQKTQFEINQAKRDAQIPNVKAVPGKLEPRKSIWESIPEDSKLVTNEQANKIAREKVFGKEPEIKKPVIKLKTKVNPEELARQAVKKATKQPISPEMPPVARVSQKADISVPETQIKAVESRLGKITDDFYQSKKGDNKIKLQDYKNLGDKVYSQAEKDFANIGSNFEDVLRKAQEDTRNGIKKLENSSLTPKEREIWKLYEAELDYIRRQASTGKKKIGGGDIGELFSPQRKERFDTEESLLAGFRTEKPGSEFKRKNKIELKDLDYSKNPIIEYFVSYGSPKAYKAERIYKTLERENPSVNKKAISKATSEFIKLQDEINSIKTKITLGIFGERRQVSSTNQIVDSASKLSEIGDTLGLQKEIISGQPKGLTNGDRVKSVEVNGQNLMDKLGLEQYRSANTFASSQFTNAKGDRLALSNSIRNRLQKDYNLPQENIDYLVKRIDNLAPNLSDEVVLSSVINTYRIAAKQQLLQQLQKVDIQNATLKKDVSDLTNQILREGSIESEFSNKIVKGILKSQNALFRKANLSSTLNELSDLSSFTSYYGTDIQLKPDFNTIKEFGLGSIDSAIEPYVRQISSGKGLKQVLSTMNKSLNWYRLSEIYKTAVVASSAKKVYMKQGLRGDDLAKAVLEDYRKLALPVDAFTKTWLENYPLYTQYLTWGVRNIQKEKRLATGEMTGGNLPATQLERIARNAYANLPAKTIFWLGSNALKGTAILTAFGLTDFTGLTNDDFSGIKSEDKNIINKLLRYNPTTTISLLGSIYESYQKEQLKEQYKNEDYNPYEFSSFGEDLKKKFTPAIVRNVGGMLELLDKGYSESKGRVVYEAPTELWDKTKGFLFGKQNTEQAREEAGTTSIFGREGNVFSNIRDMALEQLQIKDEDYKRKLTKEYTKAYKEADKTRRAELFKGGKEFNAYLDNLKKNNPAEYDRYISTFDGNQVSPEYWKTISSGKNGLDLTIFNTLKERNKQRKKDLGVDYDPIYDLNDQQAKAVLQQKSTATGDDLALRNILYKEAWYNDYVNKVKEYYKNKKPYDGEAKKETDRVIQWNDLNSKYTELGQTTTPKGNAPEWSKRYPLVYQSKLINQKYGFSSDQSKNFYKNNGDNYKAQKALYDSENLDLINQMRSIENVPMLSPEAYSQATNIKNTDKSFGKGGSKSSRKYMTLSSLMAGETRLKDVPKIKGNLRFIDLKNQPKPTILKLKRTLPKPVLRLKARQNAGIKPLTTQKIKVKYK